MKDKIKKISWKILYLGFIKDNDLLSVIFVNFVNNIDVY